MNRKLAMALLKRNKATLKNLRTKIKKNEVREEDLDAVLVDVEDLQEEVSELVKIIEELEEDVVEEELSEEERGKKSKRRAKRSKRKKMSKREGTTEEVLEELVVELDDLAVELEDLEADIEVITDDVEEIEEELDSERSKRKRRTSRAKRNKPKDRKRSAEEIIEEIEAEIEELQAELEDTQEEVDDLAADVDDIETEPEDEERSKRRTSTRSRAGATRAVRAVRAVRSSLSTRNHSTTNRKDKQIRSAFANFVVGKISESEARSLGIETGNGSVTIPKVIASEVITYAQEENLLRKYGTRVQTKDTQGYPILVKRADANVNKGERNADIVATDIEFDEVLLAPAEFDALATVTKKLLARADVPVEDIVIDELKKAYVRKETNYMFNGDDVGHENPGALAKKSVPFYEVPGEDLYDSLIKLKNTPATEVIKAARWVINRAALTLIETMKTSDGFPLLRPFEAAEGGIKHTLLGYEFDFTDDADGADPTKAVFYFGDFSQFRIQDVMGSMEIQRLVEAYSSKNKVGFQIYNVVDGQLIYSPLAPAVYRYEAGLVDPDA